jgi:hypothetical protein
LGRKRCFKYSVYLLFEYLFVIIFFVRIDEEKKKCAEVMKRKIIINVYEIMEDYLV